MKKVICLILILMFTIIFLCISFAATQDITDPPVPGTGDTTTTDIYDTPPPLSPPTPTPAPEGFNVDNENVPASGELVKTGGIPAELFYAAGGLCIIAAFVISRKKSKESTNS